MKNEVEVGNFPLKKNHLADFQRLLRKYKSVRFLSDPVFNAHENGCVRISFSGKGNDINILENEVWKAGWVWKKPEPVKKKWWKIFKLRRK